MDPEAWDFDGHIVYEMAVDYTTGGWPPELDIFLEK